MARRRTLWVPALLSSLALLTVVGGIAVGQLFWSDLHSSMGRVETSIGRARERQRVLLEQVARTQELLVAEQRRLQAESEALAEARRQLAAERAALEKARSERALAVQLVEVQTHLRDAAQSDRQALSARLADLRGEVARFAGRRPASGWYTPGPQGEAATLAAANLLRQLDTARLAVDKGDSDLYRQALQTATLWVDAFFGRRGAEAQRLANEIASLEKVPLSPDYSEVRAELARLRGALQAAADRIASDASDSRQALGGVADHAPQRTGAQ
jgi:uncharacterized protein HemX